MISTIWKSILRPTDVQEIEVPDGAKFISVALQNDQICIWYICEPSEPKITRKIAMIGTGHQFTKYDYYIGTVHMMGGKLVFHFFALD